MKTQLLHTFKSTAILFSLCLIFNIPLTHAQSKKVRLGLSISPELSWISPDVKTYENDGIRMGIRYGILGDFKLFQSDNYNFHTGILLQHLGGKLKYGPTIYDNLPYQQAEATYKFRYVDVPMVLKLITNEIGYMRYYGIFGGELGFNIKANRDIKLSRVGSTTEEKDENISSEINTLRASLVIGGGIEYNISGNTNILLGLTYHNGFTNILKGNSHTIDNNGTVAIDKELKTRLNFLALTIGVMF